MSGQIFVRQVRSTARTNKTHVKTLIAMGLGKRGKSTVLPDNQAVRGMIRSVVQWLEIVPVDSKTPKKPKAEVKAHV